MYPGIPFHRFLNTPLDNRKLFKLVSFCILLLFFVSTTMVVRMSIELQNYIHCTLHASVSSILLSQLVWRLDLSRIMIYYLWRFFTFN